MTSITITENFVEIGTKELDSKDRLSLGHKVRKLLLDRVKIDSFKVFLGKEGDLLLRPSVNIPIREQWLYQNKAAYAKVKEGLKQAKQGRVTKVEDLDKFLENL
jgi:DNA-binding transcriptional regulator/RsmH inhibitor MraZ